MKTSTNEKLRFWKQKLQEYRESGLSRKAFSEQNGVKRSTLDYWFTRLAKAQKAEGLVELMPVRLPAVVTPTLHYSSWWPAATASRSPAGLTRS